MAERFIANFRKEYLEGELLEKNMLEDPYYQMLEWLEDAVRAGVDEPTAMSLATADLSGRPSLRVVLLKEANKRGLVFLTNYDSRKGEELAGNPMAAALFFWPALERQLRIEGRVEQLDDRLSDEYFAGRPLRSRISAIISPQSRVISGRDVLENDYEDFLRGIGQDAMRRPAYWGGYLLIPHTYEFWQGRENRLNDRIRYQKEGEAWTMDRLAP